MEKSISAKTLLRSYIAVSIIVFNVLLLIVLINLGCSGFIDLKEHLRKNKERAGAPFSYKSDRPELKLVYPGLSTSEIADLIKETRAVTLGYEPYVQFKERPFRGKWVNADPRGYRPIDDQGKWPIDQEYFNIFVFGGSTIFGYGVGDNETISSYLQEILRDGGKTTVKVYNFGRCSYISGQERILLQQLLLTGNVPNLVIFIDGLNDFAHYHGLPGFTKELTRFMDEGDKSVLRRIISELPVTKVILNSGESKTDEVKPQADEVIPGVVSRYKTNKKIIESICQEFKISPMFVWQPTPVYKYNQSYNIFGKFDYDGFLPYLRSGYQAIAKDYLAGQFGDNCLWLGDMQENLNELLYVDAVHYSARMSKLIAEQISNTLLNRNLLH